MKRPANLDEARAVAAIMEASRRDPNFYVENVIGDRLWDKQQEVLRAIAKNRIVTVASCHGIGKTHLAARAAHQFLNTYKNSYVVTTAPTFRQVEELLWRQIRAVHKKSAMARSGRLLKTMLEY